MLWRLLGILTLFGLSSCMRHNYVLPDAQAVLQRHQTLAVLPPEVQLFTGPGFKNVFTKPEALMQQEEHMRREAYKEALHIQSQCLHWLYRRRAKGKLHINIVDPKTLNVQLNPMEYPLSNTTPQELGKLLGADVLLISNFYLSRPVSKEVAVIAAAFGWWIPAVNELSVNATLLDVEQGKALWTYADHRAGGAFSSMRRMLNRSLRHMSKRLPYK